MLDFFQTTHGRYRAYSLLCFAVFTLGLFSTRTLAYGPGILGLVGIILTWPSCKREFSSFKPLFLFGLMFLGLIIFSGLWAIEPGSVGPRAIKAALVIIPTSMLIATARTKHRFLTPTCLYWLASCWLVAGIIIANEQFCDFPIYRWLYNQPAPAAVAGSLTNWNIFALSLLCFPILYGLLKTKEANPSLHTGICFGIVLTAFALLVRSSSQSTQLGAAIAVLSTLLTPYRWKWFWHSLSAVLATGTLASPYIVLWLYKTLDYVNSVDSNSLLGQAAPGSRLEIWHAISLFILKNPIFGYGAEATRHLKFDAAHAYVFEKNSTILHPHNMALQLWLEFGFLGAVAGAALLVYLVQIMRKNIHSRLDCLLFASFLVWLTAVMTAYGIWQGWLLGISLTTIAFWAALTRNRTTT